MSEPRHRYIVDNQELWYEQDELAKKRWFIAANAILRDNVENTEYLAHNKDELAVLEKSSKPNESASLANKDLIVCQGDGKEEDKDMKIVRIREERYVQEELDHRVR